ncbi:MAG: acetylxylan esterase [Sphingobacteriales bacterium 17-39-43]|uniref:glucuronyl esterase domain-containing protein n=1 Tax=Daejeonella sp. TaxID=2805397 RepID=UPI000BC9433E|nr:acetylxylan esterase [Daejeonella sp.]OYZ32399.1 MAG: acetylxylan esterase [Sphingobacteriales bacterium 16-39-50]OZA25763.1 MAG: acetylxylan esterase [Sphingobacteriales bacterium 17-39-43]HQS04286.1 acetylxylan esterase [Daejeonella sp.]HQT22048.1 acetylxylan esterase [Daejeonella sp.]HQT57355.1 acetylxylan esterase [Daejeonella sp.]
MKAYLLTCLSLLICIQLHAQNHEESNYDESKVPTYTLPDVLKTSDNKAIKNKKAWEKLRRPEVLTMFEDNIYGQVPKSFEDIRFSVLSEDKNSMNGKAHRKEVLIEVFNKNKSVKINLVLFIPNNASKPAPAFLLINNRGKENTDPGRKVISEFWPAEVVIESGYAIAAFHVSDLAPDNKDEFKNGVLQLYPDQLNADNGMRAIGAWGWGASRVMDYFENDPQIDKKEVALVGHSRGGKASLWAAAQDQRFAMCITNCSGSTGAALARRQFGERVRRINTSFPHWFNTNYKKYNDHEELLPVDQHMLISLIAPRPVYATNASEDLWADPKGTFLSLKNAEDVYSLYGLKSKLSEVPPGLNTPVIESPLAYHNREGKHDMTVYDWKQFIRFADYHWGKGR